MITDATICSGWVLVQKNVILHFGLDAEKIYSDEKIDMSLITDPDHRFSAIAINRIWHRIEQDSSALDVGITASSFVLPTTFHALGIAMWSSVNLADALARLIRYSSIFHNGGHAEIACIDGNYAFVITRKISDAGVTLVTDIGTDCLFGALINIFRQLSSGEFCAAKILLTRKKPRNHTQYHTFFSCPVEFDADMDSIVMNESTYQLQFPSGNSELACISDNAAIAYLARLDQEDIVSKIRHILVKDISSGKITQEKVARDLAMSVRSLQRTLKHKNTGFQEVLDSTRKDLAKHYITQKHLSLGEISYLLGFSASNNFSRSFKSWYGVTPAKYRELLVTQR